MPIYEYECQRCGNMQEEITSVTEMRQYIECQKCKGISKKIMTASRQYTGNQDAPWARGFLGIFNKHDAHPVVRQAFKNPTKSNVMAAMRHKGYSVHDDERPGKVQTPMDYWKERHDPLMRNIMKRDAIEVRTR